MWRAGHAALEKCPKERSLGESTRGGPGFLHRELRKFPPDRGRDSARESGGRMKQRARRNHSPAFKAKVRFQPPQPMHHACKWTLIQGVGACTSAPRTLIEQRRWNVTASEHKMAHCG